MVQNSQQSQMSRFHQLLIGTTQCLQKQLFGYNLQGSSFEIVGKRLSQDLYGHTSRLSILRPEVLDLKINRSPMVVYLLGQLGQLLTY